MQIRFPLLRAGGLALAGLAAFAAAPAAGQSDSEIKQRIVERSIANYSGNCPCPYNTDRAGRRCGARSAYSRPGGASPKCHPGDVSEAEVRAWRRAER